ncbi:MAG: uroporphyrinogen-III C-methyltransferase [Rhodospirillaceae bacterium]|nr:uroporphyrinogen-III C-methyltransferase [Rhodospirillaceae bacterium]
MTGGDGTALDGLLAGAPDFEPGQVWLVGAGPGDPSLLTLAAVSALGQADVVVYDALVDPRILDLARPEAERLFAGKRGGKPSHNQADISATLVDLARKGRRVLRLKGGDPFVFGRGGEECAALGAAGIPIRIIPGITSGLSGLTAAGIPATLRGVNQAIFLATGHGAGQTGAADAIDWRRVAGLGQPIVLYMAMKMMPLIRAELRAGGLPGTTPCAAIVSATTADQRVVFSQVDRLVEDMEAAGLEPPAVIAIGEIVRHRSVLDGAVRLAVGSERPAAE